MPTNTDTDQRIVMTLDAGGTNLKFSAIRANKLLVGPISTPTEGHDLDRCLGNMVSGFQRVKDSLPEPPVAISFAFPGPADYPSGITANVGNLPAFRGGVPLGPALEAKFGIPVFLNNDGDLFVYGEAIAGFLPYINGLLEKAGSVKRYRNLFGITLGTGLGGGIVSDGRLLIGDNSAGGEAWLLRNKLDGEMNAEEGASIRAVRRAYAELTGAALNDVPEPKLLADIAYGRAEGSRDAACEAFRRMGEVAGDVLAQALTLVDGLAVIGGGISAAAPLFMPAVLEAMNKPFSRHGDPMQRLIPRVYNADDPADLDKFLRSESRTLRVPGTDRTVPYDPTPRTAVGISRLGTSEAVALGAYAYALSRL